MVDCGMQSRCSGVPKSAFKSLFRRVVPSRQVNRIFVQCGVVEHGPRRVTPAELIGGMVFHVLQGVGTLAQHMKRLTGKDITDGALSQRRVAMPWGIRQQIMGRNQAAPIVWNPRRCCRGARGNSTARSSPWISSTRRWHPSHPPTKACSSVPCAIN